MLREVNAGYGHRVNSVWSWGISAQWAWHGFRMRGLGAAGAGRASGEEARGPAMSGGWHGGLLSQKPIEPAPSTDLWLV